MCITLHSRNKINDSTLCSVHIQFFKVLALRVILKFVKQLFVHCAMLIVGVLWQRFFWVHNVHYKLFKFVDKVVCQFHGFIEDANKFQGESIV